MESSFAGDVLQGLSSNPKWLSSKYFYDATGSRIFQDIMSMKEYYLTVCEKQIFDSHAGEIANKCSDPGLQIVELGAGDGLKTLVLLKEFYQKNPNIIYSPIDISTEALKQLDKRLKKAIPQLKIEPLAGDYFSVLENLGNVENKTPRLFLFLGSNIGNFIYADARSFIRQLYHLLNPGDKILLGVDLKKSPAVILPAYSDSGGITANFNLNLLDRINTELGATFHRDEFKHYASYEPDSGEVRSYLVSQSAQQVYIEKLNKCFHFTEGETIHTEISKKYSPEELKALLTECGFKILESYYDTHFYFTDILLEK